MAKGTGSHNADVQTSWAKSKDTNSASVVDALRTVYQASRDEDVFQAEKRYLTGKTGVTSKTLPEMWREAVIGLGLTPMPTIQENRALYQRSVA